MRRSGKWYRNNERSVMEQLGLEPTPNSGSGWVVKEDGQNGAVLCQLKSTDANSIRIQLQDIQTLQYNADVAHRIPVFAIQYINSGDVLCIVRPEDLPAIAKYLESGIKPQPVQQIVQYDEKPKPKRAKITSSDKARQQYRTEQENRYKKKVRSAT